MKLIKFYSAIVLIILILVFSFANIAYSVLFYFLFESITLPLTIPLLILAMLGTGLGWIAHSYMLDLKKEKESETYDLEDDTLGQEESKEDEVIEAEDE